MHEIIVYGGAFNPPHAGHVNALRQLAGMAKRVLIVPSYRHAFGKQMAPFTLRLAWLKRIAGSLTAEGLKVEVDDCERLLAGEGDSPVYSWDVLNHIACREGLDTRQVALMVGEDNRSQLQRFHRADELLQAFPLVVASEEVVLHSTMIRQAVREGAVIEKSWLATGLSVNDYAYFQSSR